MSFRIACLPLLALSLLGCASTNRQQAPSRYADPEYAAWVEGEQARIAAARQNPIAYPPARPDYPQQTPPQREPPTNTPPSAPAESDTAQAEPQPQVAQPQAQALSAPPPPVTTAPQPADPNYVWVPGHWVYQPTGYQWVAGAWIVRARAGRYYYDPRFGWSGYYGFGWGNRAYWRHPGWYYGPRGYRRYSHARAPRVRQARPRHIRPGPAPRSARPVRPRTFQSGTRSSPAPRVSRPSRSGFGGTVHRSGGGRSARSVPMR